MPFCDLVQGAHLSIGHFDHTPDILPNGRSCSLLIENKTPDNQPECNRNIQHRLDQGDATATGAVVQDRVAFNPLMLAIKGYGLHIIGTVIFWLIWLRAVRKDRFLN